MSVSTPHGAPMGTSNLLSQSNWSPHCFDVEVTQKCSRSCRHCYLGKPGTEDMSYLNARRTAAVVNSQLIPHKRVELNLYGGEPFLAFEVVKRLVQACPDVVKTIFTNGTTARRLDVEWCMAYGVSPRRSVPHDVGTPTRQEGVAEQWIEEGSWWKDQGDTHRLVVTPETAPHVFRAAHWLHQRGYRGALDLQPDLYAKWPARARGDLAEQMWQLAHHDLERAADGGPVGIENFSNFGRALFGQGGKMVLGCGAAWNTWGIDHSGSIVPCHRFFREPTDSPLCAGHVQDVLERRPIRFGPPLVDVVCGWIKAEERDECKSCPARKCCPRGCLHVAHKTGGCLNGSPPVHCWWTRLLTEITTELNLALPAKWWESTPTPCF